MRKLLVVFGFVLGMSIWGLAGAQENQTRQIYLIIDDEIRIFQIEFPNISSDLWHSRVEGSKWYRYWNYSAGAWFVRSTNYLMLTTNVPIPVHEVGGQGGGFCDASTYETEDDGDLVPRWHCKVNYPDGWVIGLRLTPCLKEFAYYPGREHLELRYRESIGENPYGTVLRVIRDMGSIEIGEVGYNGTLIEQTPFGCPNP